MSDDDVPVVITAHPDGPFLVRGVYRVVNPDGADIATTRRTVALCRCGRSSQKPWCDSSHKLSRRTRRTADPTTPTD